MADIGPGLPQKLDPAQRQKYVLDYLIDLKLAAKKAQADKLDQSPDFARKLAYYNDKLAMEEYLGKIAKDATTEEAERKAYDEAAKAEPPQQEIHARHILLPTEDEAKKALARVKAGEDFAKVATELSKDPGGEGGDLGWFTKDRMVPEFSDAAFKLKKGEISEPVKTQFGWHIIKVEDTRTKTLPALRAGEGPGGPLCRAEGAERGGDRAPRAAKIEKFDADGKPLPPDAPGRRRGRACRPADKPKTLKKIAWRRPTRSPPPLRDNVSGTKRHGRSRSALSARAEDLPEAAAGRRRALRDRRRGRPLHRAAPT